MLDATAFRLLGRRLGVERILIRERQGRLTFHSGVVPRMAVLEGVLRDRQVAVEVRRVDPLSLVFRAEGSGDLTETLTAALQALLDTNRGG